MKTASLRFALYILTLCLAVGSSQAQKCDTSAFTFNAATRKYTMPGGLTSVTSQSQCRCLQQQWGALKDQVNAQHEACLAAGRGKNTSSTTSNSNSNTCSVPNCQGLHDLLFTTIGEKEKAQVSACNQAATKYEAASQAAQKEQAQRDAQAAALQQFDELKRAQQYADQREKIDATLANNKALVEKLKTLSQAVLKMFKKDAPEGQGDTSDSKLERGHQDAIESAERRAAVERDSQQMLQEHKHAGVIDALFGTGVAGVASLKGPADTAAVMISEEGGPAGKAFGVGYSAATNLAGDLAKPSVPSEPRGPSESFLSVAGTDNSRPSQVGGFSSMPKSEEPPNPERAKISAEAISTFGEIADSSAFKLMGGIPSTAISSLQAKEAIEKGDNFKATTSTLEAAGRGTQVMSIVVKNEAMGGVGSTVAAAAGLTNSYNESWKASVAAKELGTDALFTIPERYNNAIQASKERELKAVNAEIDALFARMRSQLQLPKDQDTVPGQPVISV